MKELFTLEDIHATLASQPLVVLVLKTQYCGVCEAVQSKVAAMLEPREHITGIYAYMEHAPEAASVFMALTSPVVLVFYEGKEVYRAARFVRMEELEGALNRYEEVMKLP